jgi:hypothetical protein
MLLGWMEKYVCSQGMQPGRPACERFWRESVMVRHREAWSGVVALCRDKHRQKWRFAKARPEWVLRYCSKAAAFAWSRKAVAISIRHGA